MQQDMQLVAQKVQNIYVYAGRKIAAGHRTMSDRIRPMTDIEDLLSDIMSGRKLLTRRTFEKVKVKRPHQSFMWSFPD